MNKVAQKTVPSVFTLDTGWCLDKSGRFLPEIYEWARPTVAVALMEGNQVLLVQSSKRSGNEGVSWILPQGAVAQGTMLLKALSAELWQELGLDFPHEKLENLQQDSMLVVLGAYVNQPRAEGDKPKLIVVVGLQAGILDPIVLNEENIKHHFVWSAYQLWSVMATTRQRKVEGTFTALSRAHTVGLIGWSCDEVLQQFSMATAA